jgi:hypothetical protein
MLYMDMIKMPKWGGVNISNLYREKYLRYVNQNPIYF